MSFICFPILDGWYWLCRCSFSWNDLLGRRRRRICEFTIVSEDVSLEGTKRCMHARKSENREHLADFFLVFGVSFNARCMNVQGCIQHLQSQSPKREILNIFHLLKIVEHSPTGPKPSLVSVVISNDRSQRELISNRWEIINNEMHRKTIIIEKSQ